MKRGEGQLTGDVCDGEIDYQTGNVLSGLFLSISNDVRVQKGEKKKKKKKNKRAKLTCMMPPMSSMMPPSRTSISVRSDIIMVLIYGMGTVWTPRTMVIAVVVVVARWSRVAGIRTRDDAIRGWRVVVIAIVVLGIGRRAAVIVTLSHVRTCM